MHAYKNEYMKDVVLSLLLNKVLLLIGRLFHLAAQCLDSLGFFCPLLFQNKSFWASIQQNSLSWFESRPLGLDCLFWIPCYLPITLGKLVNTLSVQFVHSKPHVSFTVSHCLPSRKNKIIKTLVNVRNLSGLRCLVTAKNQADGNSK